MEVSHLEPCSLEKFGTEAEHTNLLALKALGQFCLLTRSSSVEQCNWVIVVGRTTELRVEIGLGMAGSLCCSRPLRKYKVQ
jgi:hypothetical protein